jgi:formylmethanofuran dehydrogenase subunit E
MFYNKINPKKEKRKCSVCGKKYFISSLKIKNHKYICRECAR